MRRLRILLVVLFVALLFVLTSLRGIAGFYTDYLWFDSLGQTSVWRGILGAKLILTVIFTSLFFVLLWANLTIADRLAPRFRPLGPEEDIIERYHEFIGRRTGLVRVAVSALLAFIAGAGVQSQWNEWILFTSRGDFGVKDALFNRDVGWYVFTVPFLKFVVGWLFASFVVILLVTVVAHYINGGIRVQTPTQRVTPQVKAHISVLLGVLALVKAAGYWLQQFDLTVSTRGAVDGATATDVTIQLKAIKLLILISLFAVGLFIYNIFRRGWVLPTIAVGLWAIVAVIAGSILPAFWQRFQVQPAESSRERTYIGRNIEATRQAMGLDDVVRKDFDYQGQLSDAQVNANAETIRNVRLLDPAVVEDTYQNLEGQFPFYQFTDLDVDRYELDNRETQVVLSARELNGNGIPQKSWEGRHLAFTHGYGAAVAPANATTARGRPNFVVEGVPIQTSVPSLEISRPELYFGEQLGGFSIVHTKRSEESGIDNSPQYKGNGGVVMGSLLRRAAFALRFADINPLISDFITPDSRILYVRDIRERVQKLAPFFRYDADPYPVIVDGKIVWVVDGYTTTSKYPYAQRADTEQLPPGSGLDGGGFNYVRNSVKAVVDAYDGTVTFYVMPGDDPIVGAYRKAFPSLFKDIGDMPEGLRDHLRYPEDMFRVQTNMWGRYHLSDPGAFYENSQGWNVAQDPGVAVQSNGGGGVEQFAPPSSISGTRQTSSGKTARIPPYYLLMKLPGATQEEFLLFRPFVPVSVGDQRKELTAFMVAKSDPANYGQLEVYEMPSNARVDGPAIVASNIASDANISRAISLLNQQGSQVKQGNMLLIPVEQSLVYVRPLFVEATGTTPIPELRGVIVAANGRIVLGDTLQQALTAIFPTSNVQTLEGQAGGGGAVEGGGETGGGTPPTQTVAELLAAADQLFSDAETALRSGDLAEYQAKIGEAQQKVRDALAASGGTPAGGSGSGSGAPTTTTTAPGAST